MKSIVFYSVSAAVAAVLGSAFGQIPVDSTGQPLPVIGQAGQGQAFHSITVTEYHGGWWTDGQAAEEGFKAKVKLVGPYNQGTTILLTVYMEPDSTGENAVAASTLQVTFGNNSTAEGEFDFDTLTAPDMPYAYTGWTVWVEEETFGVGQPRWKSPMFWVPLENWN